MTSATDIRTDYVHTPFNIASVDANPLRQFCHWFNETLKTEITEANTMMFAIVGPHGQPSARIVLLENLGGRGFTSFTNYASHKGEELTASPCVTLLFHWIGLERQACIQGIVEKASGTESDTYYHPRPFDPRLDARASE